MCSYKGVDARLTLTCTPHPTTPLLKRQRQILPYNLTFLFTMNLYLFSFVAVFYSLLSLNSTRQSQLKQYLPRSSIIETRANEQRVGKPIGNLTTDPQQSVHFIYNICV